MQFFPTTDEDLQYFRAQGYTGSINDMHFTAMGDLGYTGALTDRIHAYLIATFGSYHEAMRDLRNGTSVFSLISAYAINSLEPGLVLDFASDYYRTNNTDTTFDSAITHAATTNATMVDSDGLLKWRPHNLLTYSEEFDNAAWNKVRATYDAGTETLTQVGSTLSGIVFQDPQKRVIGNTYKTTFRMKAGNTGWGMVAHLYTSTTWVKTWFNLSSGAVGITAPNTAATMVDAGDGWWDCTVEVTATRTDGDVSAHLASGDGVVTSADGDTVLVRHGHAFRSDLGGMVNNPDRGDSYVPTTSAARYLPRRGHHVYNGTSWVNEGLLHESDARTNLLLDSDALSTQSASVTAVAHTLHFTGAGTITLSGVSTAGPLVGTGTGENNRVSLTFTPTAGTLTLTVSGTITNAQLEAGSTPSSYIPTAGATATRAAETLTVPAANMPWNPLSVSIQMDGLMTYADTDNSTEVVYVRWENDSTNYIRQSLTTVGGRVGQLAFVQREDSSGLDSVTTGTNYYSPDINVPFNNASRHGSTFVNGAADGTALTANTTPTALPDLSATDFQIGSTYMGTIGKLRVWANDLGDTGIAEASA